MAHHRSDSFQQSAKAPWWPPLVALAVVPSLILLAIVLAALGAPDSVVVGVVVGPLLLAGLAAVVVAIGAIAYMPYALWRESTQRRPHTTTADQPSIRPEPTPSH
jgi:protein-S-isoprenylcysteine O-methyltransferase Ste14